MIMKSNFSIDFLLSSSTATSDKSGDSARTEMETKSLAPIGGDSRGSSYPQQYDLVSWSKWGFSRLIRLQIQYSS